MITEVVENILKYLPFIDEALRISNSPDYYSLVSPIALGKAALTLEQTFKAALIFFDKDFTPGGYAQIHDLESYWNKLVSLCTYSKLFSLPKLSPTQTQWMSELRQMVPIYSRYPLFDSLQGISKQFNSLQSGFSTQASNTFQEFKKGIHALMNLSLDIWKILALAKADGSFESPAEGLKALAQPFTDCSEKDLWIQTHEILAKVEQSKLQLMQCIGNDINRTSMQSLSSMERVHCAIKSLMKILHLSKPLDCPVSIAEAYLLHTSVLLEQLSIAALNGLPLDNPDHRNSPINGHLLDQLIISGSRMRPWRFSHDISAFVSKLEEALNKKFLDENQKTLVTELTQFLKHTYHYPSKCKQSSLVSILANLQFLGKIRQKLLQDDSWLPPLTFEWCMNHLGNNSLLWIEKIDTQIDEIFLTQILPRVKIALEISVPILST